MLNNAPATYQRCIDVILMGLKGIDCLVYLDDIICFSATMEKHARKLRSIFERLEQANFKIQPEKCVFAIDTVEYLRNICTPEGIRPDPKKIKAIEKYPVPKSVRDITLLLLIMLLLVELLMLFCYCCCYFCFWCCCWCYCCSCYFCCYCCLVLLLFYCCCCYCCCCCSYCFFCFSYCCCCFQCCCCFYFCCYCCYFCFLSLLLLLLLLP